MDGACGNGCATDGTTLPLLGKPPPSEPPLALLLDALLRAGFPAALSIAAANP
jgi:hypothetical protein